MNTAADRPPYCLGFTSLEHEVVIDALPVEGAFPPWLNGALLRTGPAKFEVGSRSYNHWFDGLAMLHKFALAQGRVSYANRFLRGGSYCDAERQGRIARGEFATDPCRTLFQRVASLFTRRTQTDNANVNVAALGGEVVALTEPSLPVRFDPDTLETLGVLDYQPVDDVLVQSGRRSKRMFTTIRAGMALWARRTIRKAASAAPSLIGSRISTHQPRATASFGVPAPINRRMSSPRLCPATWIRERLWTFSRPRSHVRRRPPRSRMCAKERSTRSARWRIACFPTAERSRVRLL